MSTAFLIASILGALITGTLATLACREGKSFFINILVTAGGAFALTLAATRIGVGYSDFGTDLGTGMIFAVIGGLVAWLFGAMVRDLNKAEHPPERARSARPAVALLVQPVSSPFDRGMRPPSEQQLACADFQRFLQDA